MLPLTKNSRREVRAVARCLATRLGLLLCVAIAVLGCRDPDKQGRSQSAGDLEWPTGGP